MPPFSKSFDIATMHMASRLFPKGFDTSDTLDVNSLDDVRAAIAANHGRMIVWSGASDRTIYGDPSVNHAYRAWHDWCHLDTGGDFSVDGEQKAARRQMDQLSEVFGEGHEDFALWCFLLHCEGVEQAAYTHRTGNFVVYQREFTGRLLSRLVPFGEDVRTILRIWVDAFRGHGQYAGKQFLIYGA